MGNTTSVPCATSGQRSHCWNRRYGLRVDHPLASNTNGLSSGPRVEAAPLAHVRGIPEQALHLVAWPGKGAGRFGYV
jgi:hypothetical protein